MNLPPDAPATFRGFFALNVGFKKAENITKNYKSIYIICFSSIIQNMIKRKTRVHEERALALMGETDDPPRPITVDGAANVAAIFLLCFFLPDRSPLFYF